MAFWGVELKPGNPYKHRYNEGQGRLHISQATLGSGQLGTKSITVQCNAGNKSPVLLCSLLPERIESCHLSLEFEEDYEVIFSVIGPRSVHLTGFYLASSRGFDRHGDDSDSYGEDIAESGTEQSSGYNSEDDKYESDFIDDDDLEMAPSPSPEPNGRATEEILGGKKCAKGNHTARTRRLRKKYQRSDSERDGSSQPKIVAKSPWVIFSDDEDENAKDNSDEMMTENGMEERKDDDSQSAYLKRKIHAINQNGECDRRAKAENEGASKKKKKEKNRKGKISRTDEIAGTEEIASRDEASTGCKMNNLKTDVLEEEIVNKDQDLSVRDELKKLSILTEMNGSTVPSDAIAPESNEKLKKKQRRRAKETSLQPDLSAEMEVEICGNDGNKPPKNTAMVEMMDQVQDPSAKAQEPNAEPLDDKSIDQSVDYAGVDSHGRGKKKKKKKNKTHQDDTSSRIDEAGIAMEEVKTELIEKIEQKDQAHRSKVRTFSSGLVIEELSMGKQEDKRADRGNKVSIHYTGKLKTNGEIYDFSTGRRPLKFRLGAGKVIEGLDVGVAGMFIGEKRRLTIPPSMGYGAQEHGEIPANAWLVFDVELVDVH
ncbi:hypothetical protein AAC387_Pa11g0439 [Persea americana]